MLDKYDILSYNEYNLFICLYNEGSEGDFLMDSTNQRTKFCKYCGAKIAEQAVICPSCGGQVEELRNMQQPNIVINNSNTNTNANVNNNAGRVYCGRVCNKWVAFFLCLFLGYIGAHKFYEGKTGRGILYLLTGGLIGIGWLIDIFVLLCKPNPYYVR